MRFLLDENLSAATARFLREAGHDVATVQETDPGIADTDVVAMAREAERVLVTFDSDIGERLFLHRDAPPPGVVYLRFVQKDDREAALIVLSLLNVGREVTGLYTTYKGGDFRQRPLPA